MEEKSEEKTEEQVSTEEEPRLATLQIRKEDTNGNPLDGVSFQIRSTETEEDNDSILITGAYENRWGWDDHDSGRDGKAVREDFTSHVKGSFKIEKNMC